MRARAMRRRRRGAQRIGLHAVRQRAFAVDRMPERVDDAAQPRRAWVDGVQPILECRAGAERDPLKLSERHGQRPAIAKSDDLARRFAPSAAAILSRPPRPIAPAAPVTSTSRPSIRATRPNRVIRGRVPTASISSFNSIPLDPPALPPKGAPPAPGLDIPRHLGPEALSGGKLNEANQGDVRGSAGQKANLLPKSLVRNEFLTRLGKFLLTNFV